MWPRVKKTQFNIIYVFLNFLINRSFFFFLVQSVVSMDQATLSCCISNPAEPNLPPKAFTFDGVYGPDSTTEAIYNDNGFGLVEV